MDGLFLYKNGPAAMKRGLVAYWLARITTLFFPCFL